MDGHRIGRFIGFFLLPGLIVLIGLTEGFTPTVWLALAIYLTAAVWLYRG